MKVLFRLIVICCFALGVVFAQTVLVRQTMARRSRNAMQGDPRDPGQAKKQRRPTIGH